jgi:hypothetical protein
MLGEPKTMFEIQREISDWLKASDCLDNLEGDDRITAEALILANLDILAEKEADKIDAYGRLFLSIEAEIDFLKAEQDRIEKRKEIIKNRYEAVKNRLKLIMQTNALTKLNGRVHSIRLNTSTATIVECPAADLPYDYKVMIPVSYKPDRAAIKEALKAGEFIPGCHLETHQSVTVR